MIGKKIIFAQYFLLIKLEQKGEIVDKIKTFFGEKYLIKWWSEKPARYFFELIKPERILKIMEEK